MPELPAMSDRKSGKRRRLSRQRLATMSLSISRHGFSTSFAKPPIRKTGVGLRLRSMSSLERPGNSASSSRILRLRDAGRALEPYEGG
jgi:hypothetical protein